MKRELPPQTQGKAVAAGFTGGAAAAAANLVGFYTGMPLEQQLALSVLIGFAAPYIGAYLAKNYEKVN